MVDQEVLVAVLFPSFIYRRLGNLYHFGAGKTKPEGCNTGISYYRKGQELGIVFDATTGLDMLS